MTLNKTQPYGTWKSPLTVEKLTAQAIVEFSQLRSNDSDLLWVESRAREKGRCVVVLFRDGKCEDLTPPAYSVASFVHEYGGIAYCVAQDSIYFVNAEDQNIYVQLLSDRAAIRQITNSDKDERFADLVYDPHGDRLLCIREKHHDRGEPDNDLVEIVLPQAHVNPIHQGHDFYAHARLSPDGTKLAFLAWDHPNMPWNGTQLYRMTLHPTLGSAAIVAGGQAESIFQPEWLTNDLLVYCSDRSGFYDLYAFGNEGTYTVAADEREYGHAMWQLGSNQYAAVNNRLLVAAPDHSELVLIDTFNGFQTPLVSGASSYRNVTKCGAGIAYIQSDVDAPNSIRLHSSFSTESRTVKIAGKSPIEGAYISRPERITFIGSGSEPVYAYFYAPHNPECRANPYERPPLLVQAHGGPTSSTSTALSSNIQFYTSRGWAVLDVNYSGSTGYGRAYRDRLLNEWGNRDVEDLAAGVRHLIAADLVDPRRVAIAGGSAGGYTVLRALTTSPVFKVGASRYGIADLRALASDTHKFESRYLDQLIPWEELDARSPINHVENVRCPIIFSQGLDDKVVPPNQARMMFQALKDKGIPTALFMFKGEKHGFRKLETLTSCLKGDYYFFSRVFNFEPHGIDASALDGAETANMGLF